MVVALSALVWWLVRTQPEHVSESRTIDLADVSRLALLEIVDCQPFVVGIVARGYDWVPSSLPPCIGVAFPWTRHYRNPYIIPDSLSRLVRHPAVSGWRPFRPPPPFSSFPHHQKSPFFFFIPPILATLPPALRPLACTTSQSFVDHKAASKGGLLGALTSKVTTQAQRRALTMFGRTDAPQHSSALSSQVPLVGSPSCVSM
jgi:hypothetical protein